MKIIKRGLIHSSVAYAVPRRAMRLYAPCDRVPEAGDLVYGTIVRVGQHSSLENVSGRIHMIHDGTRAVFAFGNRYAPDFYEGIVPQHPCVEVDLLARSGLLGEVRAKNSRMKDPTRVRVDGYVHDDDGNRLNTRDFCMINPDMTRVRTGPRARLILVCGTSMNSGKSTAAAACCWALSALGHRVRAAKVTGTASLKDILHMNDAGAEVYADFSFLGHPSTYLLPEPDVLDVFRRLDMKYANNPKKFWVAELADGINQRETAMLLASPEVQARIHRLILCAGDTFGAIGALRVLKEHFDLTPDALSGVCSSSPLYVRELSAFTDIPVFNSAEPDMGILGSILLPRRGKSVPTPTDPGQTRLACPGRPR